MGIAYFDSITNKLSFETINIFLNKAINQKELNESIQKNSTFYNLTRDYYELKNNRIHQVYQISTISKNIVNYIPLEESKKIFLDWFKILCNIQENDIKINLNKFISQTFSLENYMKSNLKKYILSNKINFNKLVTKGVPPNLRFDIWISILGNNIFNEVDEQKEMNNLICQKLKKEDLKQIQKDITRSFINEKDQSNNNINSLKELLIALVNMTENKNYCQGINFIVGFLLKVTNFSKIKTFYLLKKIFPKIKGFFFQNSPVLNYNLKLFKIIFQKTLPELFSHFQKNDLIDDLWILKWFQTFFTISLPFNELCHLWDVLLIYGFDFIIPFSLSILECVKNNLLELHDSFDIAGYLQNTLNPENFNLVNVYDVDFLIYNKIILLNDIILKAVNIKKYIKESNLESQYNKKLNEEISSFNCCASMKKIKKETSFSSQSTTDDLSSSDNYQNGKTVENKIIKTKKNPFYLDNKKTKIINLNNELRSTCNCQNIHNIISRFNNFYNNKTRFNDNQLFRNICFNNNLNQCFTYNKYYSQPNIFQCYGYLGNTLTNYSNNNKVIPSFYQNNYFCPYNTINNQPNSISNNLCRTSISPFYNCTLNNFNYDYYNKEKISVLYNKINEANLINRYRKSNEERYELFNGA